VRASKTIDVAKSFKPAEIDGSEERAIALKFPTGTPEMKGPPFLLHFALPNCYFHVTTAYGVLRHNGVDIGKRDFPRSGLIPMKRGVSPSLPYGPKSKALSSGVARASRSESGARS
jgi:hypothetical protein